MVGVERQLEQAIQDCAEASRWRGAGESSAPNGHEVQGVRPGATLWRVMERMAFARGRNGSCSVGCCRIDEFPSVRSS